MFSRKSLDLPPTRFQSIVENVNEQIYRRRCLDISIYFWLCNWVEKNGWQSNLLSSFCQSISSANFLSIFSHLYWHDKHHTSETFVFSITGRSKQINMTFSFSLFVKRFVSKSMQNYFLRRSAIRQNRLCPSFSIAEQMRKVLVNKFIFWRVSILIRMTIIALYSTCLIRLVSILISRESIKTGQTFTSTESEIDRKRKKQ